MALHSFGRRGREIEKARDALRPYEIAINKYHYASEYPICAWCECPIIPPDHADMDECFNRHPGAGHGFKLPGACDPANHQFLHRGCHTKKTLKKEDLRPDGLRARMLLYSNTIYDLIPFKIQIKPRYVSEYASQAFKEMTK